MQIIENTTERVIGLSYKVRKSNPDSITNQEVVYVHIPPGCHYLPDGAKEILAARPQNKPLFDKDRTNREKPWEPMLRWVDSLREGDTHPPQTLDMPFLDRLLKDAPKKEARV